MTEQVKVKFETFDKKQVPFLGERKFVRVNGKKECMYVKELNVECSKEFSDPSTKEPLPKAKLCYFGTVVYSRDLW